MSGISRSGCAVWIVAQRKVVGEALGKHHIKNARPLIEFARCLLEVQYLVSEIRNSVIRGFIFASKRSEHVGGRATVHVDWCARTRAMS